MPKRYSTNRKLMAHWLAEPAWIRIPLPRSSTREGLISPEPLDPNENLIPFNTYRINCNPFLRVFSRPGRGIEGPGMPGTNQFAVFDHALGQRASPVRAFVVQGADDAVDVGDAKCP